MQERINEIQELYRQWLKLNENSERILDELCQRQKIIKKLLVFYESDYRKFYDAIDGGASVDLTTKGEYSIMSEDALWNAFVEERELYEELEKLISPD